MATNKDYGSVSKLNSERDGLTAIKMVRDMGKVSTWFQSVGDPCRPPFKCDDLAKGYGVPKGFKGMNFFVTLRANDPRLTEKGTDSIGRMLQQKAFNWLSKLAQSEGLMACESPKVIVSRNHPLTGNPLSAGVLWVCLQVYAYPPLTPEVEMQDMEGNPI
jgi:hypothetical protein